MTPAILSTLDPRELGRRLQEARRARGRTQQDAAEFLGAARTTITAIEKGERRIRPMELARLASFYGRSVGELLRQGAPAESFSVQLRSTLPPGAPVGEEIVPSTFEFEQLCEDYLELERISGAPLARRYPPVYEVGGMAPEAAAEDVAGLERNRLALGDGPIPNLRALLENDVGLRIFFMDLPSKVAAMFSYTEHLGGCIAVNRRHPEERRRMSLAHDYAHFLAHRYRPEIDFVGRYQRQPEHERFAEAFARTFLMPAPGLRRRYHELSRSRQGSITPADLCTLAFLYAVSVEALALRLEELHLLRTGTWERLQLHGFRVREAQGILGLKPPEGDDRLLPARYLYLAAESFERGLISEGQLARFLRVDRLSARDIAAKLSSQASLSDQGTVRTVKLDLDTSLPAQDA